MTAAGGLGYAYIFRVFYLHGIFIGGLATLFAAGALAAASYKPRGLLGITAYIAGILLLGGVLIGGYVGSSFMNHQLRQDFVDAVIASWYNPDLAEQKEIWRAWTEHQHVMIALVMVIAFTAAARLLETPTDRLSMILLYTLPPSTITMAIASYLVWPLGEQAHLAITPTALALILSTTLISWKLKAQQEPAAKALLWTLRTGNLLLWLYVTIPGALIATSLYKPVIYIPPIRDPSMDLMELAFNIGHWHLLLTAWDITLLATANHIKNLIQTNLASPSRLHDIQTRSNTLLHTSTETALPAQSLQRHMDKTTHRTRTHTTNNRSTNNTHNYTLKQ